MTLNKVLALTWIALAAAQAEASRSDIATDTVINGDTLRIEGEVVRISGIDAPPIEQGCQDENREFYRCGQAAFTFLHRLIGTQSPVCQIVEPQPKPRGLRCEVRGLDLGQEMVKQGHAVADPVEGAIDYSRAEAEAQRFRRGLWKGQFLHPKIWVAKRAENEPVGSHDEKRR